MEGKGELQTNILQMIDLQGVAVCDKHNLNDLTKK